MPNIKVACFTWLVARKACLTHENLQKRRFNLCSKCYLCGVKSENASLLLHCHITGQLWQLLLNVVGLKWAMPKDTCDLLKC